jgi:membrane protease YdiL (CAAX protease family)
VEELLFRGLLMGALSGAHRLVQLGLPALLFGVFHGDWAQGAATFVLGLGFGFLRLTTRSLLIPIVAHATYNLLVLITMRSISDAQTETHQSIGVLAAGLGLAFSCAALLDRWHRRGPTATGVI